MNVRASLVRMCMWIGVCFLSMRAAGQEQIAFASALKLAIENSPRVKAAQNDLKKAQAGLALTKDMYIPSVVLGGGAGDAYGITLTVPTVFTVSAQSLVFSFQQRSYIRAARSDLKAAELALQEVRQQVEEDAAITYLSLESAGATAKALDEQYGYAMKLADIIQDRMDANLDGKLEGLKYRRGAIQIKLAMMEAKDNTEDLQGHLSEITGVRADQLQIVPQTIPNGSAFSADGVDFAKDIADTPGITAARISAEAKAQRARGDAQYTWRPQVGFGASYGRVSPLENVSEFYNLHGIYNTISGGISIQFPILDRVRKNAADQSRLDAVRAQMDWESLRSDELSARHKLQRSVPELSAKTELADVNYEIAQDELESLEVRAQHDTGAPAVTPKEVMNAHIEERQKYVEMLDARLQTRKTQITLMRLTGELDRWFNSVAESSGAAK